MNQASDTSRRRCRCEATIPPAILDGFACGNPDCWRTAPAAASFEAFVVQLKRRRGEHERDIGETADRG